MLVVSIAEKRDVRQIHDPAVVKVWRPCVIVKVVRANVIGVRSDKELVAAAVVVLVIREPVAIVIVNVSVVPAALIVIVTSFK